jgi:two-component system CheB/CheR fusion protein
LLALALPEIRHELRSAIYQAAQGSDSVDCRPIDLAGKPELSPVAITVQRFHDDEADADFFLVQFNHYQQTLDQIIATRLNGSQDVVLDQLEAELQRKREQLQETIENAEVSTEELRASNEELQAINEELRSATEELETSKEELQSVNEELITVNYELKVKVEETSKAIDDLNNLIAYVSSASLRAQLTCFRSSLRTSADRFLT